MAVERTCPLVKPDAVGKTHRTIYSRFERAGLNIRGRAHALSVAKRGRRLLRRASRAVPFFRDLVKFMISGPIMVQVLEGEDAIRRTVN